MQTLDDVPNFPISPDNSILDTALDCIESGFSTRSPSRLTFTWSSGDIPLVLYDDSYVDQQRLSNLFISEEDNRAEELETVRDSSDDAGPVESTPNDSTTSRVALRHRNRDSSVVVSDSLASSEFIRRSVASKRLSSPSNSKPPSSVETTPVEFLDTRRSDTPSLQRPNLQSVMNLNVPSKSPTSFNTQYLNIGEWYSASSIERAGTPSCESTYVEPPLSAQESTFMGKEIERSPSVQTWLSFSDWNLSGHDDGDLEHCEWSEDSLESGRGVDDLESVQQDQDEDFFSLSKRRITDPSSSPIGGGPTILLQQDNFLRATTVQFLIDQEGFRDAAPSFEFVGISRARFYADGGDDETTQDTKTIMAQFCPIGPSNLQRFHFHHAPFESPPVLRRVIVNNDDTLDYVSKQVHLTLKSNGVYVVRAQELSSSSHHHHQQQQHQRPISEQTNTKLYWQFEYLVNDRRAVEPSSASRQDLKGEKTLTPLTFSCSPQLLLPSQAKRINIMQVVKKNLATKLVAEKLQVQRFGS